MATLDVPLLGLMLDVLLPGELRTFRPPTLDAASIRELSLAGASGKLVCAVCVGSAIELPSLVTSRWATLGEVVSVDEHAVQLRGQRRVRIVAGKGAAGVFAATVDDGGATAEAPLGPSLGPARAVLEALEGGAEPLGTRWREETADALAALLRAVASPEALRAAAARGPGEALGEAARELAQTRPARAGQAKLEGALAKVSGKFSDLPKGLRHQIWSQVVEVERALGVYDPLQEPAAGDELDALQSKLQQSGLPAEARNVAKRELRMLKAMAKSHHDYATYLGHLQLMAQLPWRPRPAPPASAGQIEAVERLLDRDHTGLDKAKRRILEHLAVRQLGGEARSTVLCLAGPPGVGKTSVARSIAEALGRCFLRVALGGVHDESEIRGHRMSFVAAAPGRVIAALARSNGAPALMLLDEIDKIGNERGRSPSAALLEVLDPEQNEHFYDNYLATAFDLSPVLFVCTANDLDALAPALRDRLEIIELEGYTPPEKVSIARNHLLARLAAEHGLPAPLAVDDATLSAIIEGYTREAGVRQLARELAALHRSRALAVVRGEGATATKGEPGAGLLGAAGPVSMDEARRVLGPPRFTLRQAAGELPPGVFAGLAVGAHGGDLLLVEVARAKGAAEGLKLTGHLGQIMVESAHAALAHLRLFAPRYGLKAGALRGFHVHVPAAATPKDGPSAGVALALAMASAARRAPLRADVAATGEISLQGEILPVGGVRAKLLAAQRSGIRRVLVPRANEADVPAGLSLEICLLDRFEQALPLAFAQGNEG